MALDNRLQALFEAQNELRAMLVDVQNGGGNGRGGGSGIESRIDRIENRQDKISEDLTKIREDLAKISENVRHLPTKESLTKYVVSALTVVALLIAFSEKLQSLVS